MATEYMKHQGQDFEKRNGLWYDHQNILITDPVFLESLEREYLRQFKST